MLDIVNTLNCESDDSTNQTNFELKQDGQSTSKERRDVGLLYPDCAYIALVVDGDATSP